jgi:choline dehydrogenase-like flavoprotein
MPTDDLSCEVLVVGSGPGGAVTAALLAEAGRDVLMVEEGPWFQEDDPPPYSLEEMDGKYRRGGMTVALGRPSVTYIEGRCVGGGSEVNAGLYQRPPREILDGWGAPGGIRDFGADDLAPHFDDNERELGLATLGEAIGPGSRAVRDGARALGWQAHEVPRLWEDGAGPGAGRRRSMGRSLIPRAVRAGCRLLPSTRIRSLLLSGRRARGARTTQGRRIGAQTVFLCCGAIQTPLLLRRSGITRNIGDALRFHPAIRVVADFGREVSDEREGVPVYQVAEFKPGLTLGGSFSGLPHLAMWLAGRERMLSQLGRHRELGIFYALVVAEGRGRVRSLGLGEDPLVRLPLTDNDLGALGEGVARLAELLFAAGAREICPPVPGRENWRSRAALAAWDGSLPRAALDCSTLHLFSSCPMGEGAQAPADSWGRLHGWDNLFVNDASMLPGPPSANPQAVIMALARRNARHFLAEAGRRPAASQRG